MNAFIAIVLACTMQAECLWLTSEKTYPSLRECEAVVQEVVKDLNSQGVMAKGTCFVPPKPTV